MNYWQIGSGTEDRPYAKECLDFGMAFVGDDKAMEKVKKDDIIVLRRGEEKIVAVGRVTELQEQRGGREDKEWLKDFDGWDLSAHCYVEWHKPREPVKARGLARYPLCQVRKPELQKQARKIYEEAPAHKSKGEPKLTREVTYEEISDFLVQQGWRPEAATHFVQRLDHVRSLADHYYDFGYPWEDVKEHEIRTFLIVPLLLALGWNEREIKIELSPGDLGVADGRNRIDVACFSDDYQPSDNKTKENQKNCKLLIESKRFSSGITRGAPGQVKKYAKELTNCKLVLASNGYCYKAFMRHEGKKEFSDTPVAYLNIRAPKYEYPLNPNIGGALDLLRLLLPSTWRLQNPRVAP